MFPAPQTKVEDDEGAEKQEREQRRTGRQVVHAPCPEILDFSLQHCTVGQVGDVHAPHIRQVVDVRGPHMRQVGVHAPQVWQVGDVHAHHKSIWQAGVVLAEVRGGTLSFGDTCLPGADQWSFFFMDAPEVEQPVDVRLDLDEEEDEVEEGVRY